jgi:hypothetical protein
MPGEERTIAPSDKLVVLWTSGDRDVAMNMVFMYTLNAKLAGWWPDVTFIVRAVGGLGSWVFWGLCVAKGRILVFFGGASEPLLSLLHES